MTKKHLGQNFLFDPSILRRIISVAHLSPADTVVEIGPGHGRLTALLAERAARVIAIELDEDLYKRLTGSLSGHENVEVVLGDALRYPYETLGEFKVVANIPYYITTPVIFKLIEYKKQLESMTLMVQREVAQRIVAAPGNKDYGVLSIMVQYQGKPRLEFIVPRGAFRPVPKVDSAVLHIELYKEPLVPVKNEKFFSRVVKAAFSQRRKMLLNSLKSVTAEAKEKLISAGIEPTRRPETLSIGEFARLADELSGEENGSRP